MRAGGQKSLKSHQNRPPPRITSPTNGTIIALDPDIPPNRQRRLMDGKVFGKGATAQWLPWPGRHVVQITDAKGQMRDEIRLEVRGAGVNVSQTGLAGKR